MDHEVLDIDQNLSDDDFVKAYWEHVGKFSMAELRKYVSVVTDKTRARMKKIAEKNCRKWKLQN